MRPTRAPRGRRRCPVPREPPGVGGCRFAGLRGWQEEHSRRQPLSCRKSPGSYDQPMSKAPETGADHETRASGHQPWHQDGESSTGGSRSNGDAVGGRRYRSALRADQNPARRRPRRGKRRIAGAQAGRLALLGDPRQSDKNPGRERLARPGLRFSTVAFPTRCPIAAPSIAP